MKFLPNSCEHSCRNRLRFTFGQQTKSLHISYGHAGGKSRLTGQYFCCIIVPSSFFVPATIHISPDCINFSCNSFVNCIQHIIGLSL